MNCRKCGAPIGVRKRICAQCQLRRRRSTNRRYYARKIADEEGRYVSKPGRPRK